MYEHVPPLEHRTFNKTGFFVMWYHHFVHLRYHMDSEEKARTLDVCDAIAGMEV